jgi:hypothetical protein
MADIAFPRDQSYTPLYEQKAVFGHQRVFFLVPKSLISKKTLFSLIVILTVVSLSYLSLRLVIGKQMNAYNSKSNDALAAVPPPSVTATPTDMSQYSIFNLKKCDEIYAYAYQQAISRKNELLLLKDKIK